jgi:hypothetical protein
LAAAELVIDHQERRLIARSDDYSATQAEPFAGLNKMLINLLSEL